MNILLTTYFYLPHVGGVSTYVDNLKKELERMGHQVDVFAHHPDMEKYYMPNNGRVLEKSKIKNLIYEKVYAYYEQYMPHVDPWIRWRDIERYCFETAAAAFGLNKYDLIHAQDIVSARALWRAKPKGTPLVATIHGCLATEFIYSGEITSKQSLPWKYAAAEELYGAISSDATIVPTRWLKRLSMSEFKVPGEHLRIIPYGIDIGAFQERMEQWTAFRGPQDKKVIICPARLVPVKGHKHLLTALARLKQVRSDWVCWIVGDGPLMHELRQQSSSLSLDPYVQFLGSRSDVPALLKQAHVFVLPSLQDNLPFSVMEAQIAGKAVVVSDAGGIPEMVAHGKTGLVSPAGQSEAMFNNLHLILGDDVLRRRLGEQAKRWALHHWSLPVMMDATLDVYESATHGRILKRGGNTHGR
ncbi:glycosyltransferase family 4 protein [Paenibacillus doosanensis]|uniref:GDP-mannose-dependent alpha-(1-6)-phosphatidylinositol monomannoside mannosyltransferase n=1 Tax=Paenibacillus konkukensis TaxID=2020716 RepID=A0ABY4RXX9_9BACL|nr:MULTISPECIES: glycosyltransferase family 4 protein [Paenibacillus]MCS7458827.1 glycosyltransferase family 4 protein [Paenibacillus doosanensis]UQZ86645.1 GDP-mannose-dependent alpha-(1-6)-phosphatidylinositol monomannoside mannosyltransferase [Paenibacillus konkukensis]